MTKFNDTERLLIDSIVFNAGKPGAPQFFFVGHGRGDRPGYDADPDIVMAELAAQGFVVDCYDASHGRARVARA